MQVLLEGKERKEARRQGGGDEEEEEEEQADESKPQERSDDEARLTMSTVVRVGIYHCRDPAKPHLMQHTEIGALVCTVGELLEDHPVHAHFLLCSIFTHHVLSCIFIKHALAIPPVSVRGHLLSD